VLGSESENIYNSFVAPNNNRNMSMNQSTFYDSTGNIQSNIRKLDPLKQTINTDAGSRVGSRIHDQGVKMVANLMKNEKIGTKSR